jgi:Tfp pilus assembly protein PilN
MVSLNLLPDIKKEYLRAQRFKRLFMVGSFLVSAAFVAVVILMFVFVGTQNLHLGNLENNIEEKTNEIAQKEDLAKILTIQNQIEDLPQLHQDKFVMTSLFSYISSITPIDIDLVGVEVDPANGLNIVVSGLAVDYPEVNRFADQVKNANFVYDPVGEEGETTLDRPFSNVITEFGGFTEENGLEFDITFEFDPIIFLSTDDEARIEVPNIISSPSVTERPGALFNAPPLEPEEDQEEAQ